MSDPSPVNKPTILPIDTPPTAQVEPIVPPPRQDPPPRREPPKTIVDTSFEAAKAYALYVWADLKVLFVEIKPAFLKFATKQRNFLIGLVVFILLLLWLF